jgi:serine/threonine protein kinase
MGCCANCLKADQEEPVFTKPFVDSSEKNGAPGKSPQSPINLNNFHIEKVLGRGAFGKVFLVTKKDTGHVYAMKSLRKDMIEQRNQKVHTKTEREILGEVNCEFIVQLRFAFQTPDKLYMVMDFINGGELFFHLRRCTKFTEDRARFYAAEILEALEYLHSQGIIYRDLKPENVLLDCDGHLKLTDFGLSKKFFTGEIKAYSFCGTPEYLAPEILKGMGHNQAVDFWSFGALVYEMLAGSPPFYSRNRDIMFRNMLTKPVEMKSYFSQESIDLIRELLQVDVRCI